MKKSDPYRVLYLSHGGGPLPLLDDPGHKEMVDLCRSLAPQLGRPKAIVVVSAHWEAPVPTLTSGAHPELIYDYSGFPPESYRIQYPAPGAPALAADIVVALQEAGFSPQSDAGRGFDHGLFIPLKLLFPEADIPCVQLSLLNSLDPGDHIRMGHALSGLVQRDVLLMGSGFSFHNLKAFFTPPTEEGQALNQSFDRWLTETCTDPSLSESERRQRLINWQSAPGARYCHPREEHLLPLHLCYGAVEKPASHSFHLQIMGKHASVFAW